MEIIQLLITFCLMVLGVNWSHPPLISFSLLLICTLEEALTWPFYLNWIKRYIFSLSKVTIQYAMQKCISSVWWLITHAKNVIDTLVNNSWFQYLPLRWTLFRHLHTLFCFLNPGHKTQSVVGLLSGEVRQPAEDSAPLVSASRLP